MTTKLSQRIGLSSEKRRNFLKRFTVVAVEIPKTWSKVVVGLSFSVASTQETSAKDIDTDLNNIPKLLLEWFRRSIEPAIALARDTGKALKSSAEKYLENYEAEKTAELKKLKVGDKYFGLPVIDVDEKENTVSLLLFDHVLSK